MHSLEGNVVNLGIKVGLCWPVIAQPLTPPPTPPQFVSGQNLSPSRVDVESFKIWVVLSGIEHDSTCNLETFRKLNTDTPPLVSVCRRQYHCNPHPLAVCVRFLFAV